MTTIGGNHVLIDIKFNDQNVDIFDKKSARQCHLHQVHPMLYRPQMRPYGGEVEIIDLTDDGDGPPEPKPEVISTPELNKRSLSAKLLRKHKYSSLETKQDNKHEIQKLPTSEFYCSLYEPPYSEYSFNSSSFRKNLSRRNSPVSNHQDNKRGKSQSASEICVVENIDSNNFYLKQKSNPFVQIRSEDGYLQTYNLSSHRSSISNPEHYDLHCKVVLLGDSGVGKTCFLMKYKDGKFLGGTFISTVGIDFRNKMVDVDGTKVKLQIWDTAGQERFRSVTHAYYRDAHALLLLYDVTSRNSFDNTRAWLAEVHEYAQDDVVIMLIGNKSDSPAALRQIKREDGERLAREYNVAFMETSAKTGLNVDLAFTAVARDLKERKSSIKDKNFNVADYVKQEASIENCVCSLG